MNVFGSSPKKESGSLRSCHVEKVASRMVAVPRGGEEIPDFAAIVSRLHDTDDITILSRHSPLRVAYKGQEYLIETAHVDIYVEPDDPSLQGLDKESFESVVNADAGYGISMIFSDDAMDSFYLQIRLMDMLLPHMAALMDETAHRMFSGKWVAAVCACQAALSPINLFMVQAIFDENTGDSVWLHTHGLNRCGIVELEMLGVTEGNYSAFVRVLNQMAQRAVSGRFIDEIEPMRLGVTESGRDIVVTWKRTQWALRELPDGIMGSASEDRDEDHSGDMGAVCLYENDDDVLHGRTVPIAQWENQIQENAVYFLTTAETQRMRTLAQYYLPQLRQLWNRVDGEKTLLVKIGLKPDPDRGLDDDSHEYIWFEANALRDDGFTATLTQDAYYVRDMVEGVQKDFTYDDIVDWQFWAGDDLFYPDNFYRFIG
ncbi:MAG: DUF4026 domain-containing protein [Clostridia bacterium]|nr:DUF4026 domain-containing protein [Clostridia bacterium]